MLVHVYMMNVFVEAGCFVGTPLISTVSYVCCGGADEAELFLWVGEKWCVKPDVWSGVLVSYPIDEKTMWVHSSSGGVLESDDPEWCAFGGTVDELDGGRYFVPGVCGVAEGILNG